MKRKKKVKRWTRERLLKLGIPSVLIPGIILAITLGWNPKQLSKATDYHKITTLFPESGIVTQVRDGDTFALRNGVEVRMIGINAPNRGTPLYSEAENILTNLIQSKPVYLEYDRYQDDKYGRILAWVWIDCERVPEFLPADYMHLTYNSSREGLTINPEGCRDGRLVNEEIVERGYATAEPYKERGELKYEKRLLKLKN